MLSTYAIISSQLDITCFTFSLKSRFYFSKRKEEKKYYNFIIILYLIIAIVLFPMFW